MATVLATTAPSSPQGEAAHPPAKMTRVEMFKAEVLPPEKSAALARTLPSHIRPELFERNLLNALMQNADLMECPPPLVYREVSKAAALGVLLDPQLGEGYMLTRWNGKAKRKEPAFQLGYRGMLKLARQAGTVSSVYAHEVHEHDHITCELGDQKKLMHTPLLFGNRGRVIGVYAVVKFKDGETDFEPMTIEQIDAIRDRSDAWKAFMAKKIFSTPWQTDYVEMAKKTVLRRLLKRVQLSPDLMTRLAEEDREDERPAMRDITPPREAVAPPASKLDALEHLSGGCNDDTFTEDGDPGSEPDASQEPETVDAETGEVLPAEGAAVEPFPLPLKPDGKTPDADALIRAINAELEHATDPAHVAAIEARFAGAIEDQRLASGHRSTAKIALQRRLKALGVAA